MNAGNIVPLVAGLAIVIGVVWSIVDLTSPASIMKLLTRILPGSRSRVIPALMQKAALVLLFVSAAAGCASVRHTALRVVEFPGSVIHTIVFSPVVAWETREYAQYAQDFECRVNTGSNITIEEYKQFVHAERDHWNVFHKTEQ